MNTDVGKMELAKKRSPMTGQPRVTQSWQKHEDILGVKRRARIVQEYLALKERIPTSTQKAMSEWLGGMISGNQWGNVTNPGMPSAPIGMKVAVKIATLAEEITLDWLILGKEKNLSALVLRDLRRAEQLLVDRGMLSRRHQQ